MTWMPLKTWTKDFPGHQGIITKTLATHYAWEVYEEHIDLGFGDCGYSQLVKYGKANSLKEAKNAVKKAVKELEGE